MSLHVAPGTECNLGCTYCYEEPDREIGDKGKIPNYDMERIMSTLEKFREKHPTTTPGLHGGEPLLMDIEDIDHLFGYINEHWEDTPHIQTNGTLIRDEHIELFDRHDVSIGISCDGPPELNRERKVRDVDSHEATDENTVKTLRAVSKLREGGIHVGIITVLSERNAGTDEKLDKLLSWIDNLNRMGITGHFNPAIPYEDIQTDISLSPERLKEVYLETIDWMFAEEYRQWGPLNSMVDNLLGNGLRSCVNNKCDVSNAGAAMIVDGDGETTGCGKTWDTYFEGVMGLQGMTTGNEYGERVERYDMLKQLPGPYTEDEPDLGGCKGCKYWNICQGGCPSAGINDDWRNRTIWCGPKYEAYEKIEEHLKGTLPGVTTISDYPWNAPLADMASKRQIDIEPFNEVRPGSSGRSTVARGSKDSKPPHEVMDEHEMSSDQSVEQKVEYWKERVGEENVKYDKETGQVHADEGTRHAEPEEAGWDEVDEE